MNDSATTANSSIESMAQKSSLSLISNSTQAQSVCAVGNTVVLQIALSNLSSFYCRDLSALMDSVRTGPVCEGGVEISSFVVDSSVKDCHQLTLCGQAPVSTVDVAQRIDGTSVQQLTFKNLPWGCQALLQASTDSNFPSDSTQTISLQVLPPTCPYCVSANKVTCLSCDPVSAVDSTVVAGQVIPNTCSGGCHTCTLPGGITVAHMGTQPFYTTQNVGCGQACSQVQQIRVCNNGSWVPGNDSDFSSQCQEPSAILCQTATASNTGFFKTLARSVKSVFGGVSGSGSVSALGANDPVTCASCQSGACATCTTASGASGFLLYSQTYAPSGGSCQSYSQCEACSGGLFQGDPSYKYGSCSILGASCTAKALTSPVSSGASQVLYNNTSSGCTAVGLQCANGTWVDGGGVPVAQTTVDGYGAVCITPTDCTTAGGVKIKDGTSIYVYTVSAVDAGDSCFNHYTSLGCVKGAVSPSDPGPTYKYASCSLKTCPDPTDATGVKTLNAGVTVPYYSVSSADCSQSNPQAYCDSKKVSIACGTSGGTATISPAGAKLSDYKYGNCAVPASCSGCVLNTTDSGKVTLGAGSTVMLFKNKQADFCQSIGMNFSCQAGQNGAAPTLVSIDGSPQSAYPYMNCAATGSDQGSGGGTGGGTGNDSGPGSALKKRFGMNDGGGGGGSPCIDATVCHGVLSAAVLPNPVPFTPCLMPWGTGEIEFYGSVVAFSAVGARLASGTTDTVCVVKPDTCSKHRQSRTCHYPAWTGGSDYVYPNCVEKASCP